ncbi:MAG: ROK family transcriptional regulator [Anaerolineae bacterium]|nr:ROK family transcriptional regulator [Anaerolineae bacterium]
MVHTNTADQNTVRKHNTRLIIENLRAHQPLSRAELAGSLGLNRSTVSAITNHLVADGVIIETEYQSEKIGRPGLLLRLNPAFNFSIGIDLGVDYIAAAVLDFDYQVRWEKTIPSDPNHTQAKILQKAISLTQEALVHGCQYANQPLGIGIGVPGLVDTTCGILKDAPNLGWVNVPLLAQFREQFQYPIFLENEANAAALGEFYLGSARDCLNFVYISGGVGIGGGIMMNGELLRGSHGFASEVGHIKFDLDGDLCKCGSRGCVETTIGTQAITRKFRQQLAAHAPDHPLLKAPGLTLEQIAHSARSGDPTAISIFNTVSRYLGILAADLVNIFNPELVILGGAYHQAADLLLQPVTDVVMQNVMKESREALQVCICEHGVKSGVVGAAALVYDQITKVKTDEKE